MTRELKQNKIIHVQLQPMSKDEISQFMLKYMTHHAYSDKKICV